LDLFSKSGIAIGGGKNPPVKNKKELRLQISLKIIKPARNLKRKNSQIFTNHLTKNSQKISNMLNISSLNFHSIITSKKIKFTQRLFQNKFVKL